MLTHLSIRALLSFFALALSALSGNGTVHAEDAWHSSWTAAPQPIWNTRLPLPSGLPAVIEDRTIRQVIRVSTGGKRARIVLSNRYGTVPLRIGAAWLGVTAEGARMTPDSQRVLTFSGRSDVVLPPGATWTSDPVDITVPSLTSLSISLYLPERTAPSTMHWDARQTAYLATGDQTRAADLRYDSILSSRLFITDVLLETAKPISTVAILGDSITDGNGATLDMSSRWPDFLAERLADSRVAVLNAGISGARLLTDGMGDNALARFERDVLSKPHIETAVILLGINDIAWPGSAFEPDTPVPSLEALIAGYRQLITQAHLHNVRIVGATLLPFEGALQDSAITNYHSSEKERLRQQVNEWIRGSDSFDAVVDFDAWMRDPAHPTRLLARYDSGDHLHPGDAGNQAMAERIDLQMLFGKPLDDR